MGHHNRYEFATKTCASPSANGRQLTINFAIRLTYQVLPADVKKCRLDNIGGQGSSGHLQVLTTGQINWRVLTRSDSPLPATQAGRDGAQPTMAFGRAQSDQNHEESFKDPPRIIRR